MGMIFQLVAGKPVVADIKRVGCWIEVSRDGKKALKNLCKLELDPQSPLTPRTSKLEALDNSVVEIDDGVWWCSNAAHQERFLVVRGDALSIVTKAQAYCALGAVERLQQMGLGDAAIALAAGEFDLASVQVIAERERRTRG